MTTNDTVAKKAVNALIPIVIFVGVLVVIVTIWWATRPAKFQPTTYETGNIAFIDEATGTVRIPQAPGYQAPSVLASEPVPILLGRCSTFDMTYAAEAETWFQNAETGERFTHSEDLPITIEAGCTQVRVSFEIPLPVIAFIEFDAEEPIEVSSWFIAGEVVANRPGATAATWQTESFTIVNDSPPLAATPTGDLSSGDNVTQYTESGVYGTVDGEVIPYPDTLSRDDPLPADEDPDDGSN